MPQCDEEYVRAAVGEEEVEKPKPVLVELDEICPSERKKRNVIDMMHFLPNFFVRHLEYMNGDVPKKSVMKDYPLFSKYLTTSFTGGDAMERLAVPEEVMLAATRRLNDFFVRRRCKYPWVNGELLLPRVFKSLTCERKCVFALCLFDWVFQDSLQHPYIFALKNALDLIGSQYNLSKDLEESSRIQAILDFFLSMIESCTPPGFGNTSTHNPHHLHDSHMNGGSMKEYDNFFHETLLGKAKNQAMGGRNPEFTMCKRMFLLQHLEMECLSERVKSEKGIVVNKKNVVELRAYASILDALPWKDIVYCNFVDDLEFHHDDTVGHLSFVDAFPSFGVAPDLEGVRKWKDSHPPFRRECVVRCDGGAAVDENTPRFFSTVSWYGKTLHSCSQPVQPMTYEWLLENENAIAFMLTADSTLFVCTIIGYAVFRVNGLPYIQAVCLPMPCSSTSSFTKTPHKALLHTDVAGDTRISVISLFRLHIGKGIVLKYASGVVSFRTMTLLLRQSKPIGHVQLFEHVINKQRPNKRRGGRLEESASKVPRTAQTADEIRILNLEASIRKMNELIQQLKTLREQDAKEIAMLRECVYLRVVMA